MRKIQNSTEKDRFCEREKKPVSEKRVQARNVQKRRGIAHRDGKKNSRKRSSPARGGEMKRERGN